MGSYQSFFQKTPEQSDILLSPNKSDWVTGHADMTGLAVVEVERYWTRFKQLGCDKFGNISAGTLERGELSQDVFIKNIIANLPKERDGSISFLVFLKFVQWCEQASEDEKLKVIFNFLNNGKELDIYVMEKLVKRLYPNIGEDQVKSTSDLIMDQLDEKMTGYVNEQQFVNSVKRLYPAFQLSNLLKFDLIPVEVMNEANMQTSTHHNGSMMNMRRRGTPPSSELSDSLIEKIANKIVKRDWERLALKLGFLEFDIDQYKTRNRGNDFDTIVDLLMQWRDQDPFLATKSRLKTYLDDSNMSDAAALLF